LRQGSSRHSCPGSCGVGVGGPSRIARSRHWTYVNLQFTPRVLAQMFLGKTALLGQSATFTGSAASFATGIVGASIAGPNVALSGQASTFASGALSLSTTRRLAGGWCVARAECDHDGDRYAVLDSTHRR
jgi:hypothetical protein